MYTATRFHPRQSDRNLDPAEDEGLVRRKLLRSSTANSTTAAAAAGSQPNHTSDSFRKPSLPASATRQPALDPRPSLSQRRRSTLREHVRIPSGPRDPPNPSRRHASISSTTPSLVLDPDPGLASTTRPSFSGQERSGFGRPAPGSVAGTDSPITPAERVGDISDFIPTMSFDDFHNSIADYDGTSPLLSNFPLVPGTRMRTKEDDRSAVTKPAGFASTRPPTLQQQQQQQQQQETEPLIRNASFRRTLSATPGSRQASGQSLSGPTPANMTQTGLSMRTRVQSGVPDHTVPTAPLSSQSASAAIARPRKSVGPGLITSMMEGRKVSNAGKGRRTTMQPSMSAGAELPRISTLTATTQSRANKVKSLQPLPRDFDPNTPTNGGRTSKGTPSRTRTPSSSGNRRQSTVSGRASGLGARTVSPTDARRLKRLSMMQAPPMPAPRPKEPPPPPQEEVQRLPAARSDPPRLAQPSPSLIPRKISTATPTSARASPDARHESASGMSLNSKSSYQSLLAQPNPTSRLPTPKQRNVHSSSAQYGEATEFVPPVPAIPKAYESPKDYDLPPFFSNTKSSHSAFGLHEGLSIDFDLDGSMLPAPVSSHNIVSRGSMDVPSETPRKRSTELGKLHKRTHTIDRMQQQPVPATGTPNAATRPPPDVTGRSNGNLQPLRLPPLNLMPINTPTSNRIAHFPRPSQEVDRRGDDSNVQTPEPRRVAKTPSTPMTASKATFLARHDEEGATQKHLRSSTSHYTLRDAVQLEDSATRFFEDSDMENVGAGVSIHNPKQRSAITPFASGSLPKSSGEFVRIKGRPSGDYRRDDGSGLSSENLPLQNAKSSGPRPKTIATTSSTGHTAKAPDTPSSLESPLVDQAPQMWESQKKDGSSNGLRRRLSKGWRRSSSKNANPADDKVSLLQTETMPAQDPPEQSRLQKMAKEMGPPRLPASASASALWPTGSGDAISHSTGNSRPSLDSIRRKSTLGAQAVAASGDASESQMGPATTGLPKTRSLHSENPQPVNRASSWGNLGSQLNGNRPAIPAATANGRQSTSSIGLTSRHKSSPSTLSAIVKDKDDLAADDEMRRLSQKRRDVDSVARESEQLKARAVARSPMTTDRVLHDRNCSLNIFERGEIVDYESDGIFFTGTRTAKKVIGSVVPSSQADPKAGNCGYDDERGDYNIVLGDHLAYRYEVVDMLGKGSFGQVVRCVDHKDGGVVAVKIIRNKKRFHQQALVEVGILGRLGEWDPDGAHATLSITSSFYFRSHLCIVTPCLSINLYELIRAHNFVGFSLPLIRRFARQLLTCLVLLQHKRIIHCDLKPENILLCEARKADVRVIDFGSSCREEEKVYTYIQSRFYRSPEVILGSTYGLGIDMWSLGCILAELWTGYPLFPGENEQEQLACIMEIFGPPDRHLVERCTRKKLFFDSVGKPRVTVSSKGRRRRPSSKTLTQALKTEDEAFVDFVARCLRWDPEKRLKPTDAVGHPFITNLPLNLRTSLPDDARRAARVRSSAAVPTLSSAPAAATSTTAGGATVSPTKRATIGHAFEQQQPGPSTSTSTPIRERSRALPETPQTAVRTAAAAAAAVSSSSTANNAAASAFGQGSPSKAQRRHSTLPAAGGGPAAPLAAAGSKRASNGALLLGSGKGPNPVGLAQLAARESMGGAGGLPQGSAAGGLGAAGARWRG